MTPAVVHPRIGARRGGRRATTWWGRAWVRAVEESAYGEKEQRTGRALARAGAVGGITVDVGSLVASVEDDQGLWTARVSLPVLDDASMAALVEVVAAEAGRAPALLAGELPHPLVEHAEEMGVELLPYGGELDASCTCDAWVDPCVHALALLTQATCCWSATRWCSCTCAACPATTCSPASTNAPPRPSPTTPATPTST